MRYIIILLSLWAVTTLIGQSPNLAYKYYHTGEFEKSAQLYKKLYEKNKTNTTYFDRYIESLLSGNYNEEALESVKKEIRSNPKSSQLYVYQGRTLNALGREDEAEASYLKAISYLGKNSQMIQTTARAFVNSSKQNLAIKVYEKGNELYGSNKRYAYELGDLHRMNGDKEKMIPCYLDALDRFKHNINYYFKLLQSHFSQEDIKLLQKELYARIQDENADPKYYDVLEWSFLELKQYKKALRQARSIDRRTEGNGYKVHEMGRMAYNGGDLETASEAFLYILDNYGSTSQYYLDANKGHINILKSKILDTPGEKDQSLIDSLIGRYQEVLDVRGRNRETARLMIDYANTQALINNNTSAAKKLLNEVIDLGDVDKSVKASAKIDLADYLLIDGERWESTLLYSQVDKDFQEAELGEIARFRNAMLSYYSGDFEWAQEQFDVLKRSTSRLISNDAIDMSVFIQDNLGLDTTAVPLELFSTSDLLIFQNKYSEAFDKLDSIEMRFPDHGLLDDILYRKASMYAEMGKYDEAVAAYKTIVDKYKDEIKADNAIYDLAVLYEEVLDKKSEAKKLYESLFIDYPMSTLTVEARKRFRKLRGDNI